MRAIRATLPLSTIALFGVSCASIAQYGVSDGAYAGFGESGAALGLSQDSASPFRSLADEPTPDVVPNVADPDAGPSQGHELTWTESVLPFFGNAARERGYELPKPLGIGANFVFINRPTEITSVRAGTNGNGLSDVNFLQFQAEAAVRTALARFDAWIFPMLNVYALGGYIWNTSEVQTVVDLPGAPSTPIVTEGDLEGPVYGGGATLAGGYKEWFLTLDANFTRSELGALSVFDAGLYSVRTGWNTKLGSNPLRVYVGATYWDTKRTIEGSIPLSGPIVRSIEFAVDQQPVDPWTVTLGGTVTLAERLWLMLEVGGWEGTQVMTAGFQVRF
ncbi:MAG: hypothetical protein AAF957_20010 [Planctomycetota bacterium]